MNARILFGSSLVLLTLAAGPAASAITPAQLSEKLRQGAKITIIDIRSTTLFQQDHIPGAISVPAGLVPQKNLPPLGQVVVYDDGVNPATTAAAAAALSQKPGITAEVLDGGLPAWQTAALTTTQGKGIWKEQLPRITYAQLKEAQSQDVVLVDLRKTPAAPATGSAPSKKSVSPPLTDLSAEFPLARTTRSPFSIPSSKKSSGAGPTVPPLLVLIDSGDGTAEQMARTLRANGNTRVVILAGGEAILARKGQPGLDRAGTTMTVPRSAVEAATLPAH